MKNEIEKETNLNLVSVKEDNSRKKKLMWKNNIENAVSVVTAECGSSVANSVFAKYDAHGFHDLSPLYYSEVFADLEMIANDN